MLDLGTYKTGSAERHFPEPKKKRGLGKRVRDFCSLHSPPDFRAKKMPRVAQFALLALLAVSVIAQAPAQPYVECDKVVAVAYDGQKKTFDFTAVQRASGGGTPYMALDNQRWIYEFSVCANGVKCQGTLAPACQTVSSGSQFYLGSTWTQDTPARWIRASSSFPKGAVTFTLAERDTRAAEISVVCDPLAKYVPCTTLLLPLCMLDTSTWSGHLKSSFYLSIAFSTRHETNLLCTLCPISVHRTPTNVTVIPANPGDFPYVYQLFVAHDSAC